MRAFISSKRRYFISTLLLAVFLLAASCASQAEAVDASYFRGKTITIIVATNPGGGFDTDARLLAQVLGPYLGCTILVQNMPGGGHIVGTNYVWNSRPDGFTIGMANIPGLIAGQIRGEEGIDFDLREFSWLARLYMRHRFLFARTNAGFDSIEDLIRGDREFKLGAAGIGDGPYNTGILTGEAFGINNIRLIPGYGGAEEALAIMRREIEGAIGGLESWQQLIDSGDVRPILIYGAERYPDLPDVPTFGELLTTDRGMRIASYVNAEAVFQRGVFAPPGTPDEIRDFLGDAIMHVVTTPEFNELVASLNREPFDPLHGDDVEQMMWDAMDLPDDVRQIIVDSAVAPGL